MNSPVSPNVRQRRHLLKLLGKEPLSETAHVGSYNHFFRAGNFEARINKLRLFRSAVDERDGGEWVVVGTRSRTEPRRRRRREETSRVSLSKTGWSFRSQQRFSEDVGLRGREVDDDDDGDSSTSRRINFDA